MEAKIVPFKTKEQRTAEVRFRHLADHLIANPCKDCADINSEYCSKECRTGIRKRITRTILDTGKSF